MATWEIAGSRCLLHSLSPMRPEPAPAGSQTVAFPTQSPDGVVTKTVAGECTGELLGAGFFSLVSVGGGG